YAFWYRYGHVLSCGGEKTSRGILMHEPGDAAARVVQVLTDLLTATDRAAADPGGVLAGLADFLSRSFQDSSPASELLARWRQHPADPGLRTAVVGPMLR